MRCLFSPPTLSDNSLVEVKPCTAEANTVCQCKHGYYCSNDNCDHCVPAKTCSEGEGVQVRGTGCFHFKRHKTMQFRPKSKVQIAKPNLFLLTASRTNNTICELCRDGTYSNVTDLLSPCRPHTRYSKIIFLNIKAKSCCWCL